MLTLEELLQAWSEAEAKAKADPNNKVLLAEAAKAKKAYEDRKAEEEAEVAGRQGKEESHDDKGKQDLDESKWDEKTKAYIKKLRDEAAAHRTKAKDLGSKLKMSEEQKKAMLKAAGLDVEDEEKPEEKIKSLTAETQEKEFRLAILESAIQHGITGDALEYYEFLVRKATSTLGDGEELGDEQLSEIVSKAKKFGKAPANTSVGGGKGDGKPQPKPGASGEVSLDQFVRMSIVEKSALYEQKPEVYKALFEEAKRKRKLI